jgi:hypothetical protein
MKHAIKSMFRSVLGVHFAISERKQFGTFQDNNSPMVTLGVTSLGHVCGGGGEGQGLPKGGW